MLPKEKLTKYTAHYRCPDTINNFKVRIRYIEWSETDTDKNENWRSVDFPWQRKRFSRAERDFYGDVHNCVTDLEKKYHELIIQERNPNRDDTVFSYIEEDGYISEEMFNKPTYLHTAVENSVENQSNVSGNHNEFVYEKSLASSIVKTVIQHNFENMYIMADLGEYVENIWIKNEQQLCHLKFDVDSKVLTMYPDFTTTQPYYTKIQGETVKHFYYFIENSSDTVPEEVTLAQKNLIKKLVQCNLSVKNQVVGDKFHLPPKNKLYTYLFFEILAAKDFENSDEVYVQYYIDLPEHWSCETPHSLKGVTQTCHGINEDDLVHFGHCFDVTLEYAIQNFQEKGLVKTPYIYFEVISKTSWDRYRTEGLTYKNLPIFNPGCFSYTLSCFRFGGQGLSGNLRRFFIGDCSKYKDITWIGIPNNYEGNVINKFGVNTLGTGELKVRLNILHQSQAFLDEFSGGDGRGEKFVYEKLSSSSLIRSVEQVLHAFRRARKNMMEVRKNI